MSPSTCYCHCCCLRWPQSQPAGARRARRSGGRCFCRRCPRRAALRRRRARCGRITTRTRPVLFRIDPTGRVDAGRRHRRGAWSTGRTSPPARCGGAECLYIADIGDNRAVATSASRSTRSRFRRRAARRPRPADAFHATYPDAPHDAEALLRDTARRPSSSRRTFRRACIGFSLRYGRVKQARSRWFGR